VCERTHEHDGVNSLKSEINVQVDDHISWFKIEKVKRYLASSVCPSFKCLNHHDEIKNRLIKPITWRIEDKNHEDFDSYPQMLAFYLLPQKASFQREGKNIKRNSPLDGPNCKIEIKFVS